MRLCACHIENFGTLSDVTVNFPEGIFEECRENGWGKSTLVTFLLVMLFGFRGDNLRNDIENERRHFRPWQGGVYGGSLTFEQGGKTYCLTRTFGDRKGQDKFEVREVPFNQKSDAFPDSIGEALFGMDRSSFERTAFFGRDDCGTDLTELLKKRLGGDREAGDGAAKAVDLIQAKLNRMSPDRKTGSLSKERETIAALRLSCAPIESTKRQIAETKEAILQCAEKVRIFEIEQENLVKKQKDLSRWQEGKGKRDHYLELSDEVQRRRADFAETKTVFPCGEPPKEELAQMTQIADGLDVLLRECENHTTDENEKRRKAQIADRYGIAEGGTIPNAFSCQMLKQQENDRILRMAGNRDTDLSAEELGEMFILEDLVPLFYSDAELSDLVQADRDREEKRTCLNQQTLRRDTLLFAEQEAAKQEEIRRKKQEQERMLLLKKQEEERIRREKEREELALERTRLREEESLRIRRTGIELVGLSVAAGLFAILSFFFLAGTVRILLTALFVVLALFSLGFLILRKKNYEKKVRERNERWEAEANEVEPETAEEELFLPEAEDLPAIATTALERKKVEEEMIRLQNEIAALDQWINDRMKTAPGREELFPGDPGVLPVCTYVKKCREIKPRLQELKEKQKRAQLSAKSFAEERAILAETLSKWFPEAKEADADLVPIIEFIDADRNDWEILCEKEEKAENAKTRLEEARGVLSAFLRDYGMTLRADADTQFHELTEALTRLETARGEVRAAEEKRSAFARTVDVEELLSLTDPEISDSVEELEEQRRILRQNIEEANAEKETENHRLSDLFRTLDELNEKKAELSMREEAYEDGLREVRIAEKTLMLMQEAERSFNSRYTRPVMENFKKYYDFLSGGDRTAYHLDTDTTLTVEKGGLQRDVRLLSAGLRDLTGFCYHLALTDTVFPEEKPPLVLDDPFADLDEAKIAEAKRLLHSLSPSVQILYFTCHPSRKITD